MRNKQRIEDLASIFGVLFATQTPKNIPYLLGFIYPQRQNCSNPVLLHRPCRMHVQNLQVRQVKYVSQFYKSSKPLGENQKPPKCPSFLFPQSVGKTLRQCSSPWQRASSYDTVTIRATEVCFLTCRVPSHAFADVSLSALVFEKVWFGCVGLFGCRTCFGVEQVM